MYVTSASAKEIRLTLEVALDLVNALSADEPIDSARTRAICSTTKDSPVPRARPTPRSHASTLVWGPCSTGSARCRTAPTSTPWSGSTPNSRDLSIAPTAVTHDGAPLHIHWTPSTATFDDQVIADILMALAQEVCDHGTTRFGRCAATDCDHLYYDATRNGSRRFCSDPRCASRTHTADHRARRRNT